jgi:hypothetical protein
MALMAEAAPLATGLLPAWQSADRIGIFPAHPESVPDLECFTDEAEVALGDLERISEVRST